LASGNPIQSLGFIGFGEVGRALASGLKPMGADIAAYDILFDDPTQGQAMREAAQDLGVKAADRPDDLADTHRLIISCVTASSASAVVTRAASWLAPGQYLLDVNSISPQGKQEGAGIIAAAGGRYVEGVIMSPIHPLRHKAPMLFGGPNAEAAATFLNGLGMAITVASPDIGFASANKMCRSIMVKGLEALVMECLVTARHYGVEDNVLASLQATFPGMNWRETAHYMLERVLTHGKRRAEEMRFSAKTVEAAGWTPHMTAAIAERMQWAVDTLPQADSRALGQQDMDTILDRLVKELKPAGRGDPQAL
jgi:3-hydroxyisobutyrate dehydrogenase-like beta-hydroxyacid dehydrogenase